MFCSIVPMKEIDGKAYMTRRCRILGTEDGILEVDLKDGYKYRFDAKKVFLDSKTYKNYFDRLIYIDRDHYRHVKKLLLRGI